MAEMVFTKDNFEKEVLQSELPVLIDFWAPWCGPCRMVSPIVKELAEEYAGKVKVGTLNVDENQDIAVDYSVRGIPTLMIFKNGEVADSLVGAAPKTRLEQFLLAQL